MILSPFHSNLNKSSWSAEQIFQSPSVSSLFGECILERKSFFISLTLLLLRTITKGVGISYLTCAKYSINQVKRAFCLIFKSAFLSSSIDFQFLLLHLTSLVLFISHKHLRSVNSSNKILGGILLPKVTEGVWIGYESIWATQKCGRKRCHCCLYLPPSRTQSRWNYVPNHCTVQDAMPMGRPASTCVWPNTCKTFTFTYFSFTFGRCKFQLPARDSPTCQLSITVSSFAPTPPLCSLPPLISHSLAKVWSEWIEKSIDGSFFKYNPITGKLPQLLQ